MARSPETKARLNRVAGRGIASLIGTVGRTIDAIQEDLRARIEPVVRRPRKVDISRLDPKPQDVKTEHK